MAGDGLPTARLGDIVEQRTERAVVSKKAEWPYIGLEHMQSGSPDLTGTAHCSTSTSTNGVFHKGDVLFGKLRPYLRKSVGAPFSGYCSTDILVLRPEPGVDHSFAAKLFQSEQVFTEAVATSIGTKMPRTSWSLLRSLEVFCPGPLEQRRIAEILDTLDEAIRKTEEILAKLHRMKQGLLQDLLTRGIDDNGELRDPVRDADQFRDSILGRIPKEWEIGSFEDFSWPRRPFLKTGPFGSSLKGEHWVEKGVPVITIGALGEGEFNESELLFVSDVTAARLSPYTVEPNDIVFSRVADVGRSVVVTEAQSGWIMSSNLMWISLDPSRVVPKYVWLNLSSNPAVRQQVRRAVNAGGREVANGTVLRSFRLAWPSLLEQQRIVQAADMVHRLDRDERAYMGKLRAVKSGLTNDLLTGRVRIPAAGEASA